MFKQTIVIIWHWTYVSIKTLCFLLYTFLFITCVTSQAITRFASSSTTSTFREAPSQWPPPARVPRSRSSRRTRPRSGRSDRESGGDSWAQTSSQWIARKLVRFEKYTTVSVDAALVWFTKQFQIKKLKYTKFWFFWNITFFYTCYLI